MMAMLMYLLKKTYVMKLRENEEEEKKGKLMNLCLILLCACVILDICIGNEVLLRS